MNEQKASQIYYAIVSITCDDLTDRELAALNIVAQLGDDPHDRLFDYSQVKELFTEANGTKMHELIRSALAAYVNMRLNK